MPAMRARSIATQEGVSVSRRTEVHTEVRLVETSDAFKRVQSALEWIQMKQSELENAEFGSDLNSAQQLLTDHHAVHREINEYRTTVEACKTAKASLSTDEQKLYSQYLSKVEVAYSLLTVSVWSWDVDIGIL